MEECKMEFIEVLRMHNEKYPTMNELDFLKLCFQSAYGPGHIIQNKEKAKKYFDEEVLIDTNHKDDVLKYTSMYEAYIRENTEKPFWLVNTNKLVKFYEGLDGLKTGYTSSSRYNLTATAERNGLRFITVIMDAETSSSRNADTTNLMNHGFNNYKVVTLYKKGETITSHTFHNAKTQNTPIIVKEDITYVTKKNEQPTTMNVTVEIEKKEAPITSEEKVGRIIITNPNTGWQNFFDIYSKQNVEKIKFKDLLLIHWKVLIN